MNALRSPLLGLVLLAAAAPRVLAQDPPKPPPTAPATPTAAVVSKERLAAWPKPVDKDTVLTDIERVIKAHVPEMAEQGRDALVAAGASAVPFVLDRYGRERDEDARERLHEVLMRTTTAEQTRLLAKEFESKLAPVRTFTLHRAAAFPDSGIAAAAEKAWARLVKAGDKADPDEKYAAALCTASAGSTAGIDALFEACQSKRWDREKREIRTALEGARGKPATDLLLAKLDKADRKTKVAVLRMLAGCGEPAQAARLRLFLDDEDNAIRVAAINALRGMVDNEPPIEDLAAFEAIEMAKTWKGRKL
ncbi:MAG: HEAT repeat domain-containing protein [Planctomycetota bacterium]|nr:HEAT repeat domain-containing protein [Planctomycetota bacterium]